MKLWWSKLKEAYASFVPSINLEHILGSAALGFSLAQLYQLDGYTTVLVTVFMAAGGSTNDLLSFFRNKGVVPTAGQLLTHLWSKLKKEDPTDEDQS